MSKKIPKNISSDMVKATWKQLSGSPRPGYSGWLSPDNRFFACIHEVDQELVAIYDLLRNRFIWMHPKTIKGARRFLSAVGS